MIVWVPLLAKRGEDMFGCTVSQTGCEYVESQFYEGGEDICWAAVLARRGDGMFGGSFSKKRRDLCWWPF